MESIKIILWGAGNTAKEALEYISDTVVIIGILDNNPTIKEFEGIPVLEKEHICTYNYDYMLYVLYIMRKFIDSFYIWELAHVKY